MSEVATASYADAHEAKDRLEVLDALISAPGFDPIFRDDVIRIPRDHPVLTWGCQVAGCERALLPPYLVCTTHREEWLEGRDRGMTMSEFRESAVPLRLLRAQDPSPCLICGDSRPAAGLQQLCLRHGDRWYRASRRSEVTVEQFDQWLVTEKPYESFGDCRVPCCDIQASYRSGLCTDHHRMFQRDESPGRLPRSRRKLALRYDEKILGAWLQGQVPVVRSGRLNLIGLHPLLKAEIKCDNS